MSSDRANGIEMQNVESFGRKCCDTGATSCRLGQCVCKSKCVCVCLCVR